MGWTAMPQAAGVGDKYTHPAGLADVRRLVGSHDRDRAGSTGLAARRTVVLSMPDDLTRQSLMLQLMWVAGGRLSERWPQSTVALLMLRPTLVPFRDTSCAVHREGDRC